MSIPIWLFRMKQCIRVEATFTIRHVATEPALIDVQAIHINDSYVSRKFYFYHTLDEIFI